ncbi:type IV secretory system conjugative DNA transfer family protein [Streptomyces sp. NBC_01373]|uniref:type IV secretory system conjugative DNA transfer family protein n=1 Tax=Streptomyces sp. NBC_01373 TaxID=2903843 RepID=UPI00225744DE|nr:TraM recognition domain-containing protein [Streptomyces sp. NBC_01373]MCX4699010.1 TraM recognition domain-containing protein [Streptomyces sp. NBC_01373]
MTLPYRLNFPAGLDADQVTTWLHAASGTLTTGSRRLLDVSSMVFEVEADERGIQYRLVVPEETVDFLTGQLRTLIPGSTATPAGAADPAHHWTVAVELGQTNPRRSLGTVNPAATAASLLAGMQGLGRGEAIVLQWVVSPALRQRPPQAASELVLPGRRFASRPNRDRINDIRAKLSEPNFLAVLRVAVKASTKQRGEHLLARVRASLRAVGTSDNRLKQRLVTSGRVVQRISQRVVPTLFPMQLAGSELVALICWPIGSPHVAGLPRSRTRQLAATGAVSRSGRVIARSNFPGNERPLALGVVESTQHLQVVGPTGSGKTVLLSNLIEQDMHAGRGVILIESKGDLFHAVLDRVPQHRLSDVILLDVSDTAHPVGFNILTGSPYVVAADIQRLFDHLYPQDSRGVRVRAGFYHLILTLKTSTEARGQMTFADIGALAVPRPDQEEFAARLIRGVSHVEELASWWQGFSDARTRATHFQPILDRIWQLNNRPSIRNIIGQSRSTVDLPDLIRRNKILLVNLGRATEGRDTAGLLGSLLLNSVWSAVQAGAANPARPTMLYLDEFQDFINLPISPADMFAQARSLGLAMTVAHQHLGQLTRELQDATKNNARSTVVFQTSADEARDFARQFGRSVADDDFVNLARFEVLMRLATSDGVSSPMSAVTYPPIDPTDSAGIVRRLSRRDYARPVAEVEAEIKRRRGAQPAPTGSNRRRQFGGPRNGS